MANQNILDWLRFYPDQQTAAPVDVLAAMAAAGTPRLDSMLYTYTTLCDAMRRLGATVDDVTAFVSTIASLPGGPVLDKLLVSGGADLSRDDIQAGLAAAAQASPSAAPLLTMLANIGKTPRTAWQEREGLATPLPTEQDISDAQAWMENMQTLTRLMTQVINPAVSRGDSLQSIKDAVAAFT